MAGPIISITEKGKEEAKRLIAQWEKENPGAYEKLKKSIKEFFELWEKDPRALLELCLKAYYEDLRARDKLYIEAPRVFFETRAFFEKINDPRVFFEGKE